MGLGKLLYSKLRNNSPERIRSVLTRSQYYLGRKPLVLPNMDPNKDFPGSAKAALVFSADFELAWAFRYSKKKVDPEEMAKRERMNFPILLELFDTYQIPVTWAAVGHLFLGSCKPGDHDWMKRIPYFDNHWQFLKGDWFFHDPYSSVHENNSWYAPDLIQSIIRAKVKHEIGCHTFSHINCKDEMCPPDVLDDELKACKSAAKEFNVELRSFVFPGGTFGNYQVIKDNGFTSYRRSQKHQLFYPYLDDSGLLVLPSSIGLDDNNLGWSYDFYLHILKQYILKAIKTRTVVHFWFHPSLNSAFMKNVLPPLLEFAGTKRKSNDIWIGTMGELTNFILGLKKTNKDGQGY